MPRRLIGLSRPGSNLSRKKFVVPFVTLFRSPGNANFRCRMVKKLNRTWWLFGIANPRCLSLTSSTLHLRLVPLIFTETWRKWQNGRIACQST